jgi:hypothetical protein
MNKSPAFCGQCYGEFHFCQIQLFAWKFGLGKLLEILNANFTGGLMKRMSNFVLFDDKCIFWRQQ